MALTRTRPPDLLGLIGRDTELRFKARTRGGEYAGSCPFCHEGTDRLRVQPERNAWNCRRCTDEGRMTHWEDDIGYVRRRHGVSFAEACRMLEIEVDGSSGDDHWLPAKSLNAHDKQPQPPSEAWQEDAWRIAQAAHEDLLGPGSRATREWLRKERGLGEDAIRTFMLGRIRQGHCDTITIDGEQARVTLPPGISIPLIGADDGMWGLKIRLPPGKEEPSRDEEGMIEPGKEQRYLQLRGSGPTLMGQFTGKDRLVLCEGEMDMMLLWQVYGDQLDVATYGSCTGANLHDYWFTFLRTYKQVYVCLDFDDAGAKAGRDLARRLQDLFYGTTTNIIYMMMTEDNYVPHPTEPDTVAKDITDIYHSGMIDQFIGTYLEAHPVKREKVMTPPVVAPVEQAIEDPLDDALGAVCIALLPTGGLSRASARALARQTDRDQGEVEDLLDLLVLHGHVRIAPPDGSLNPSPTYVLCGGPIWEDFQAHRAQQAIAAQHAERPPEPTTPPAQEPSLAPMTVTTDLFGTRTVQVGQDRQQKAERYQYITEAADAREALAHIGQAPLVGLDTETTGLDPHAPDMLRLVQISTPEQNYVFDARRVDIAILKPFLEDKAHKKILQNAKFDYQVLKGQRGIALRGVIDTMLAERVLMAGISRESSLAALSRHYLNLELDKKVRDTFINFQGEYSAEQLSYASRDVEILFAIHDAQRNALGRENLGRVAELEYQCVVPVAEMELAGLRIDVPKWRELLVGAEVARDIAEGQLREELRGVGQMTLFGTVGTNLRSNPEMLSQLHALGKQLTVQGERDAGKALLDLESTEERHLAGLKHPAVRALLAFREQDKILGTYGENVLALIKESTGRLHPDFQQLEAETGRMSCRKPNVQNIPADSSFRSCFIPADGYSMVCADYSGQELRILAEYSQDDAFMEAFRNGEDLHSVTASRMFNTPVEGITKDLRSRAKIIAFGMVYGAGPTSTAARVGVTKDEAIVLMDQYFRAYPGIKRWLDRAAQSAVQKGYAETLYGRKRYFPALPPATSPQYREMRGRVERQGKNGPIQSLAADMTKLALVGVHAALIAGDYDARIVNAVHDEIVVEARTDQAEAVSALVSREMVRAGEKVIQAVPVIADAHVATCWSK